MRERKRILNNLEAVYRADFEEAKGRGDHARMRQLELDFQRDQLYFEVLLDLRDLLLPAPAPGSEEAEGGGVSSILDTAQKLRKLTRFR